MLVLVSPSKQKRSAKAPASTTKSNGKATGKTNCKGRRKLSPKPKPKPKPIETSIPVRPRTDVPTPIGSPPPPYTVTAPIPPPFVPRLQPQYASNPPPIPYGYLPPPPVPAVPADRAWIRAFTGKSCTDLREIVTRPIQNTIDDLNDLQHKGVDLLNHKTPICDLISSKFNAVITSIDGEIFSGDEKELVIFQPPEPALRGGWGNPGRDLSRTANNAISSAAVSPRSTNYFAKVNLYANSRLPPYLPPFKLQLPAYPLVCLAAQYSQRVYAKPTGKEREAHVDADWRIGTKAMVIKSIPIDDMNTVVFAIRGSQTFMDWAVNLRSAPASPEGFLDDPGNMCHAGFLSVARKMIKPVAARLRSLLEEDPSRSSCSLIMTGHSAGGAVASLLFAHMLAEGVRSELNILTGCFKRIHCITFGAPPISLLPIHKPNSPQYRKSLFLSFINEGDPVPRSDRAYIRSLFDLYTAPAPGTSCIGSLLPAVAQPKFNFGLGLKSRPKVARAVSAPMHAMPVWRVPPGSLSIAGRVIVLRAGTNGDEVRAEITSDEALRRVVFGDPVMHMMKVYARRVEVLATKAVTAKMWN